ncbi:Os09g0260850 [Oryza sativa Japonica Group]|uniref:Os09g0260850 protein n=1 Tax=Oryza sativa subsp. japonica TaxID=39947 RepID=A0A0P0XK65_ORYSJ|nr:Os09g0260850 [Oryza sativa Japonica Group]
MASETPPPLAAASTRVGAITLSYILRRLAPACLPPLAPRRRALLLGYFFHPADTLRTVPLVASRVTLQTSTPPPLPL